MADISPYPSDRLRGVLEVCVLRALVEGPTWGYAIAEALAGAGFGTIKGGSPKRTGTPVSPRSLAGAGFGTIKGGTLYPLLNRLEAAQLVETEWRPGEGGPRR